MANATEQMRVAVDKMDIGESDFNLDEWAEAFVSFHALFTL